MNSSSNESLLRSNVQGSSLPSLFTARPEARSRLRGFFSSHYPQSQYPPRLSEAVRQFSAFCAELGILDLAEVEPIHVAAFVEVQLKLHSKPAVKLRLAALRMLFDWMATPWLTHGVSGITGTIWLTTDRSAYRQEF